MRIISWNVNGIRSAARKGFLEWLDKDSPDIICAQEIKVNSEALPAELVSPPPYTSHWSFAKRKGYSGVAVYTKPAPIRVATNIGIPVFDREGRALLAEYADFILLNVYFLHGSRDKSKLPQKLKSYDNFLDYVNGLKKPVVLCGDFNVAHDDIDLARPNDNRNNIMFTPAERKCIDRLLEKGFCDIFREFHRDGGHFTWWPYRGDLRARNIGWRIDYIFVSRPLIKGIKDAFILPRVGGSDHCPVGIEFEL